MRVDRDQRCGPGGVTNQATLPEWEIEEALAWKPELLSFDWAMKPTVVARQRYLSRLGRFIDLLLSSGNDNYIVVELKADRVEDPKIVIEQVVPYRLALAREMGVASSTIQCVLASPLGFSREVLLECQRNNVLPKMLDLEALRTAHPEYKNTLLAYLSGLERAVFAKVRARREHLLKSAGLEPDAEGMDASVKKWVTEQVHDELSLSQMAASFKLVSNRAPIMAHEVWTESDGHLESLEDMWFWLFYSVLDRRANAATFVKARRILTEKRLFLPYDLIAYERKLGETATLEFLAQCLQAEGFPLSGDSKLGKIARPKSILDAAMLLNKYSYDFRKWFTEALEKNERDRAKTFDDIWSELVTGVYGVGPRIASQFVRGMVLKGPWQLPLTDRRLLEKSPFNSYFSGPDRFCLVQHSRDYESDLAGFADRYLEGNKAIVSHVLWYVRKRYESDKIPACWECPMAGFCSYYLKIGHQRTPRFEPSVPAKTEEKKRDTVNLEHYLCQVSPSDPLQPVSVSPESTDAQSHRTAQQGKIPLP